MSPSLTNLKLRCHELRLDVKPMGKRPAKEPYLQALRACYLKRDFPNGLPYQELCPMLAFPYWSLKPAEQELIWRDDNGWAAQQKFNGNRIIVHFVKDVGVYAHSRVVSTRSFRRTEKQLFGDFVPSFTATVDGEEVETVIHVFDITNWNGLDLRPNPLWERILYLGDFGAAINAAELGECFGFPPISLHGKPALYDAIIKAGGEGVVLKNLNSRYLDCSSRSRYGWIKVKRSREFTAFVSGFGKATNGKGIGYLVFSVHTEQGDRVIAKVANIPKKYRRDAEKLLGRVALLTGQELSRKALRLTHPKIIRWDRLQIADQCHYALADFKP